MDAVNSKEELFSKRVDESRNTILVESKGELCSNRIVDSRNTILPPKPSHLDIGSVKTKGEKIRQNVFGFGKRILVFTFSHVGLVCVVIGYSIFGAVIFQALESPQWNTKPCNHQWNSKCNKIQTMADYKRPEYIL